jgi:hypothetical protein
MTNKFMIGKSTFAKMCDSVTLFTGIISQKYYCITSGQISRMLTCADKPSKREMSQILSNVMMKFPSTFGEPYDSGIKRTAKLIRRKKPDLEW